MNVFVKTDAAVRDFAQELSRILGKMFAHIQTDVGDVYCHRAPKTRHLRARQNQPV
jgi:hypothetical protein